MYGIALKSNQQKTYSILVFKNRSKAKYCTLAFHEFSNKNKQHTIEEYLYYVSKSITEEDFIRHEIEEDELSEFIYLYNEGKNRGILIVNYDSIINYSY